MGRHLVFYDGACGLCDHIVQLILRHDQHYTFDFAPLQGETARQLLKELPEQYKSADSLVLIENYKGSDKRFYLFGKGALRICWLMGGWSRLFGTLSFLPSFLYDWAYRLVAKNRHRFFKSDSCIIPDLHYRDRFLP